MKRIAIAAVLLVMLVGPARAGFDEGVAAYERGDYATALKEFRPLAEQGDADAQCDLGEHYAKGENSLQDVVAGHKWYSLCAALGGSGAGARDELARAMTDRELAQARRQAREWWAKFREARKKKQ